MICKNRKKIKIVIMKKIYCLLGLILLFASCKKEERPVVLTGAPTMIEAEQVTLVGTLVDDYNSDLSEVGVLLGATASDVESGTNVSKYVGTLIGTTITSEVTGLEPGVNYYYCAFATSEYGMGKGEVLHFETLSDKPVISIQNLTVEGFEITVTAHVDDYRGAELIKYGFICKNGDEVTPVTNVSFDSATDTYTTTISGLMSNQEYEISAYAENIAGPSLSAPMTAKTMTYAEYYTSTFVNANGVNISAIEVPAGLYNEIYKNESSNELIPLTDKSYAEVEGFIRKLNAVTGKTFRLPTREEWQMAANDGNTYSGSNNINDVAWYAGNTGNAVKASALLAANAYGLYDMSGNVWEFTSTASGENHYICGGCYNSTADQCEVGHSMLYPNGSKAPHIGFRLVLE